MDAVKDTNVPRYNEDMLHWILGLLAKPVFFVDACCECGKIGVSKSVHTKYSHHRGPRVGGFIGQGFILLQNPCPASGIRSLCGLQYDQVVETARQQNRNVFAFVTRAVEARFAHRPTPLLFAGQ